MALRKKPDVKKETTAVRGISPVTRAASRGPDYEYAPGEKERMKSGAQNKMARARKDAKNPIKKVVKRVKQTLPKTTISEHVDDIQDRNLGRTPIKNRKGKVVGSERGQSREAFVKEKKARGETVTGRLETKKGWGKNAKVKKRIIE
jgi:hypothetical protein